MCKSPFTSNGNLNLLNVTWSNLILPLNLIADDVLICSQSFKNKIFVYLNVFIESNIITFLYG